ncbi:Oligosaccharyltransferase subunit Ribophorin II-domain-containing protein [Pyronema omphalodes]|nr:Oligosaccharyltransferase subunit Ribophorin II-domain-containing protein [Pyronema omphalodes]
MRSLLLLACCSFAAAEWTFSAGKATIASRGDPEGSSTTFSPSSPIASTIPLSSKDILKLTFTINNDDTPGRPHQAFLLVKDSQSSLETFFPLNVKETSGKAKVDLAHKDLPAHLLSSPELSLSLALGSFGTPGSLLPLGSVAPIIDDNAKAALEKQRVKELGDNVIYGPKKEIHHVFRPDAMNPPKVITLAFLFAVLAGYLGLFGAWFPLLGANFAHLPKALQAAPLSHSVFFVSLVSLEAIFFMYYTQWNLFQTLGGCAVAGLTCFLTGSRALREVRARRERGER